MNAGGRSWAWPTPSFVNPNGLDANGHYSTAADMAKVARYAMKNEKFREFVSTPATVSSCRAGRSR